MNTCNNIIQYDLRSYVRKSNVNSAIRYCINTSLTRRFFRQTIARTCQQKRIKEERKILYIVK